MKSRGRKPGDLQGGQRGHANAFTDCVYVAAGHCLSLALAWPGLFVASPGFLLSSFLVPSCFLNLKRVSVSLPYGF